MEVDRAMQVLCLPAEVSKKISTEQVATALCVAPQTIRAGLCRNGHYMGLRPLKLPNGRLLWPFASVQRLLGMEGV